MFAFLQLAPVLENHRYTQFLTLKWQVQILVSYIITFEAKPQSSCMLSSMFLRFVSDLCYLYRTMGVRGA